MIAINFKLALMLGLGLLAISVALAVWVERRRSRRAQWHLPELRPAFEAAPFGLLFLNHTQVEFANPAARRILPSLPLSGALPASAPWRDPLLADLLSARQSASGSSYRIFSLGDDQHISWSAYPFAEGRTSLVFLLDLTQQRKLEGTARLFLNTLSHELRTPLTAILAHIEVLRRADTAPSVQKVSLDLIHQEANRLARLVHDLLTLNRLETMADLNERPVNLLLLVEDAIAEVFPLAEAQQLALSLEADSPLSLVSGNDDYLKQAILNLLDNALKYCRPGDEIKVLVKNDPAGVLCQVADTGPGIPAEHLPHLTRRFFRVNKTVEGTGLGLALVAEILHRHHSLLQIESQAEGPHTGTTVSFVLPV